MDAFDKDAPAQDSGKKESEPEKDLFVWKAPARPFKKRERDFWITVVAVASIFGLILFLVEGVMPVILIISIVFLFYVLSTVKPEEIELKITNKGVNIAGQTTGWNVITRFWFSKRLESDLLVLEMKILPGRLEVVVNSKDVKRIKEILTKYVPEQETSLSGVEKAADWLSRKLSES